MEQEKIEHFFKQQLEIKGIILNDQQLYKFQIYFEQLIDWNEKINLTAITNKSDVYIKHFIDSISLSFFHDMNKNSSLIDIGSGAGFPSIPLKIIFPSLKITIIDSLYKRILFLKNLISMLNITDVICIHGRAEDLARDISLREQFDFATARAVAKLCSLNELCIPFLKVNGFFLAMKGSDITIELENSFVSLNELQSKLVHIDEFHLPQDMSIRKIIAIKKLRPTPSKYPRKAGIPIKNPLL